MRPTHLISPGLYRTPGTAPASRAGAEGLCAAARRWRSDVLAGELPPRAAVGPLDHAHVRHRRQPLVQERAVAPADGRVAVALTPCDAYATGVVPVGRAQRAQGVGHGG